MAAWDKVKGVLATLAPTIGTAFGGPLGGLAGATLAKVLTGDPKTPPAQVEQQILAASDPDTFLKLKQAEQEFQMQLKQADIDLEKVNAADRASAREREVAVKDWTPKVLAYAVTIGFFSLLWFFCNKEIPTGSKDTMEILLGMLATAWAAIITYYFGSSAGSAAKTDILAKQQQPNGK